MHYGQFTSHWNYPANMAKMYASLKAIHPYSEPYLVVKVSEGIGKYNDGIGAAVNAKDAGFRHIGPLHFYDRRYDPIKNADTFLSQWDKFPWTVRPSLDNELVSYMPNPNPLTYPGLMHKWFERVRPLTGGKPGIMYANVSFVTAYLQDPTLTIYGLWLSQTASNTKIILGAPTVPLPWIKYVMWQKQFVNKLGAFFGLSSVAANIDECPEIEAITV